MENQIEQLIIRLSDEGLKEVKETAAHSETVGDFIAYMEFDIAERQQAILIATQILEG
jgi:hypothetical protein